MIKILFICHGSICRSPMSMFAMREMVRRDETWEGVFGKGAGTSGSGNKMRDKFQIDCAAASSEEIGNPVYPPARRKLNQEGIRCDGYAARKMVKEDYDRYDYIIGMDQENLHDMYAICEGNDPYYGGWRRRDVSGKAKARNIGRVYDPAERRGQKISLLLDYTDRPGQVADPWYTGDFEATWRDVQDGCRGFLRWLAEQGKL